MRDSSYSNSTNRSEGGSAALRVSPLERWQLKQQLSRWRIGALILLGALLAVIFGDIIFRTNPSSSSLSANLPLHKERIARVEILGVVLNDRARTMLLSDIAEDDSVKAVIVDIDSPGGTVVGGEEIYHSLRNISKTKPVVVTMGNMAASAGYMIALGGDHLIAREGTVTGSIGVLMRSADATGLLHELGIKPVNIKSSPLKAVPSPLEELTPEAERSVQRVVDGIQEFFLTLVSERRNLTGDALKKVADGRIFTGRQALSHGLVDSLGGEEEALAWLEKEHELSPDLPVVNMQPRRNPSDWLDETFGSLASLFQSFGDVSWGATSMYTATVK